MGNVPLTGDEFSNLHVVGLPQQTDEGRNTITVLDGHLVFIVLAVGDVPKCAAGFPVHFGFGVIQKADQNGNPFQLADVLLNFVILVAEVLQVGGGVGLHRVDGVTQHGDDLWEIGVPPAGVLANAVDGR